MEEYRSNYVVYNEFFWTGSCPYCGEILYTNKGIKETGYVLPDIDFCFKCLTWVKPKMECYAALSTPIISFDD